MESRPHFARYADAADPGEKEVEEVARRLDRRLSLLRLIGRDGSVLAERMLPVLHAGHGSDSRAGEKAGDETAVGESMYEPGGEVGVATSSWGGEAVDSDVRDAS